MSTPEVGPLDRAELARLVHRFLGALLRASTPITEKVGALFDTTIVFSLARPDGSMANARVMTGTLAEGQYVLRSTVVQTVRLGGVQAKFEFPPDDALPTSAEDLDVDDVSESLPPPLLDLYEGGEEDDGEEYDEDEDNEDEGGEHLEDSCENAGDGDDDGLYDGSEPPVNILRSDQDLATGEPEDLHFK